MSKFLRYTFLIQAIIAILCGAGLLIAPGRFLGLFGWGPIEPLLFRLLGAALLAMAWTSIYAFRASSRAQVEVLVQMQLIFCGLGALGFFRHLITGSFYPTVVWIVTAVLVLFTAAWTWALFKK